MNHDVHLNPPPPHERSTGLHSRIEPHIPGRDARSRLGDQRVLLRPELLGQVTEALPPSAAREVSGDSGEFAEIMFRVMRVLAHDVGQVPHSAHQLRTTQTVDDGPFAVRNRYPLCRPPHRHGTSQAGARNPKQPELLTGNRRRPTPDVRGRNDEGRAKELFSQTPVLCSAPTPDVARREDDGRKHPGIFDGRRPAWLDFERQHEIDPSSQTEKPAAASKTRNLQSGCPACDTERLGRALDRDHAGAGRAGEFREAEPGRVSTAVFYYSRRSISKWCVVTHIIYHSSGQTRVNGSLATAVTSTPTGP